MVCFANPPSFNPCFGGFFSKTLVPVTVSGGEIVSILVLVDFSLKRRSKWQIKDGIAVSILVLVDFSLKQGNAIFRDGNAW